MQHRVAIARMRAIHFAEIPSMLLRASCLALATLAAVLTSVPNASAASDPASQLAIAVMSNEAALARSALATHADAVNVDTGEGRTPLIVAAMATRPVLVKVLLDHGADPVREADDAAIGNAVTAAFFAMNGAQPMGQVDKPDARRHEDALEVLRLLAAKRTGLDLLVRRGPTQVSALMIAAQAGALDAVRILIEAGADPNVANAGKYTALDYAVDRAPSWSSASAADRVEIARLLLAAGARVDHRAADHMSSVERARSSGIPAMAALFPGRPGR
jgi:hypothetical protein